MYLAYTFEEIMDYHPDNRDVYSEIKEKLSNLVPFVGAGLTRFAYHSWKDALKELASKITNRNDSRQVKKLIRDGRYMDAAQQLENLRTPSNLARDIANLFSSDHLSNKMSELPKEAVSLLPLMFHGLVLTTNFDETLETVYREYGQPFQTVSHPGHPVLEQFIRNQNHCGLFKMHGTVTGNLIEYENIVFTSAQYDRHYRKGSPLIHDLKACFGKRLMFFLGCSLEEDRTMDILQYAIIKGVNHYAIIGCNKSKKDEKIRKLGEKYIRVILYEQGRHEAVRVILEHLLEETRPDIYQKIHPVGALKSSSSSSRFSYDAGIVPLSGRKKELEKLNKFLQAPDILFQWWAITGPSGCGKSRLTYEFQNQLPIGWNSYYLRPSDYANLNGISSSLTHKTLLIADDVQEHARELGEWMESLNEQRRSLPIRLLLVEREPGKSPDDSVWTDQSEYSDYHNLLANIENIIQKIFLNTDDMQEYTMEPGKLIDSLTEQLRSLSIQLLPSKMSADKGPEDFAWTNQLYSNVHNEIKLKESCYQKTFLSLPPLSDQDLLTIMEDYAIALQVDKTKKGKVLDDKSKQMLLQKLKTIDPSLCRPLYAMFLTDAYIDSNDIEQWKRTDILNNVISRETKRIEFSIRNVMQTKLTDSKLYNACVYLQCAATALQGISVENLPELFPYIWKIIEDKSEYFESPWDFLYQIGLTVNDNIPALRPDLVGEYFVYDWLFHNQEKKHDKTCQNFIFAIWNFPRPAFIFFERLIEDFNHLLNAIPKTWDIFFTDSILSLKNASLYYSKYVLNATYYCNDGVQCEKLVSLLEKIFTRYPHNPEIATAFAGGLFNLSNKQDVQYAERTVGNLEIFYTKHTDITGIASELAKSLFNLSNRQDRLDAERTIERLEKLSAGHPDAIEITILYAKGLFNLSNDQDEPCAKKTIERLKKLYDEHLDVSDIAVEFAKGLYNLSRRQNERDMENNIKRLERLYSENLDVTEMAILLANGLFNLSIKQTEQDVENTMRYLEKLSNKHPNVTQITAVYVGILFNLIVEQNEQNTETNVNRLKKLSSEQLYMFKIIAEYVKCHLNLNINQDEQGAERIKSRLDELSSKHPDVTKIADVLTKKLIINYQLMPK